MKLIWPIKRSFVGYVRGNQGTVTLSDGATESEDGFVFSTTSATSPLGFTGSVHFEAHGGMLDVTIGDPEFAISGDAGTLSVATDLGERVTIARLTGIDDGDPASGQLLLTYEGTRLLGDVYAPGSQLDGFRIEGPDA